VALTIGAETMGSSLCGQPEKLSGIKLSKEAEMWLFGKKPVPSIFESQRDEDRARTIEKSMQEIQLLLSLRASRIDEFEAYLQALVGLHPEVRDHPKVLEFERRRKEYEEGRTKL